MSLVYPGGTASVAEAAFWSSLTRARAGMPCAFQVQHKLSLEGSRIIPDFTWPEVMVLVEIDGRAYHSDFKPFTRDRQKDRMYLRAGWTVIRFAASEVLGAGGADLCVRELFETLGWSYPDVLEAPPDADLTKPLPAPAVPAMRVSVEEVKRESSTRVKRRWYSGN